MKLLIHSQTSTVQPLKFGNLYVISSRNLMGMWLLIYAGIKLIPVSKTGPWQLDTRNIITVSVNNNETFV